MFLVFGMYNFGVAEEALTALPQLIQFLCSQAANLKVLLDICFLDFIQVWFEEMHRENLEQFLSLAGQSITKD